MSDSVVYSLGDSGVREGKWVSIIGGGVSESGQTYSIQEGTWSRINRRVWFEGRAALTAKGTITGNVVIKGLPFKVEPNSNLLIGATIGFWNNTITAYLGIHGVIQPNFFQVLLYGITAAGAAPNATLVAADISNTFDIVVSGSYLTDQ